MQLNINITPENTFSVEQKKDEVLLNGVKQAYDLKQLGAQRFLLQRGSQNYEVYIQEKTQNNLILSVNGHHINLEVKDHIQQILERLGMDTLSTEVISGINAPMPGSILEVSVKEGDTIKQGDKLIILEAMKMENVIKSPIDGVVDKVLVTKGENVEKNQPLIAF